MLRDPVALHVLGQVADPQVPRLAHHPVAAGDPDPSGGPGLALPVPPPPHTLILRAGGKGSEGDAITGNLITLSIPGFSSHCAEKRFTFTYRRYRNRTLPYLSLRCRPRQMRSTRAPPLSSAFLGRLISSSLRGAKDKIK